ncbi:MAG: serine acetyltransferase [Endozoicomonadaceae bacterium]|nr:serine acetyltransferase [Endozoicomonadaceae bacterium]
MHLILRLHKIANFLYSKKIPLIPNLIWKFNRIIFSCDMKYTVKISNDVCFFHNGLGVVVHPRTIIGNGCKIYQNVTFGGSEKIKNGTNAPTLGDNVFVGAGAVLLGPVNIGDNAVIGANAVVTKDIKADTTVVGVPARDINNV